MDDNGSGSGQKRIDLLKAAAKQLVDTLALQAAQIKQVDKPVQFALVPFAASVNVGPAKRRRDLDGRRGPVADPPRELRLVDARRRRQARREDRRRLVQEGAGWGDEEDEILSRFSLYKDMKKVGRPRMGRRPARNMSARASAATAPAAKATGARPATTRRRSALCELAGLRRGPPLSLQRQRRAGRRAEPPTPASASAIPRRCSCRCSRPTSRATAGRPKADRQSRRLQRLQQLVERRHRELDRPAPARRT